MDQLKAYEILGLEPGSSPEEVKEAYASLSKQYHPEEEPEKFQEIHEAYITLTRRKRRGSVQNMQREPSFEEKEVREQKVTFDEKEESEQTYSFEEALEKAKIEEAEKSHELVLEAFAELKILVSPKYKNNLKAYKSFFEDKKYESIIRRADFLEKLCDVLEETKLMKNIYKYIIDFYRLRGRQKSELSKVGLRLYQILDEKAGIKQEINPGVWGGIVASLMVGFHALRPVIRQSEVLSIIVLVIAAVFLVFWIFKKLRERSSILFTQAVIAIGIALSQFIVIMFDLYGTIFGSVDDGNSVAAMIFLAAVGWFVGVILVVVVKAIIGLFRK